MPFEITSRNCVSRAMEKLWKSLAATAEVQAFLGVASAVAAEARIYLFETPETAIAGQDELTAAEWADLNPYILIKVPDDGNLYEARSIATGGAFAEGFAAEVVFSRIVVAGADSQSKINLQMLDIVGEVIEQMQALQGSDYFYFTDVVIDKPIWRGSPRDQQGLGDTQEAAVTFAVQENA